jgi:hypothetical protein
MASALPSSDPWRSRTVLAAAALLWVAVVIAHLFYPVREILIRVIPDDALFYLVIARNGAAGVLSSFDGINPTNGYHPLWLLVLQPLAFLLRGEGQLERAAMGLGLAA